MRVYVVRHGQTDLNAQKRIQARHGLPLNAEGVRQAQACAKELKEVDFEFVFSSPQKRAIETASVVSGGKQVFIDERLDAFDVGTADNLKIDENLKLLYGLVPDGNYYDGVEDTEEFRKRIYSFLDELRADFKGRKGAVLIAGHKCTTGCIDAYFNGWPKDGDFFSLSVKNGKYKIYEL